MTTIKKYFLYACIFNAINLSAMDLQLDTHVEKISKKIDVNHLGINKYFCCRSTIISPVLSILYTTNLSEKNAAAEIKKIRSYIPSNITTDENKQIFSQLTEKHLYVHYLIENLIHDQFSQFKNVKGSTIDTLYQPQFTDDTYGLKEKIYTDAKKRFCEERGIESYSSGCYRPRRCYYYNDQENRDKIFLLYLCQQAFVNSTCAEGEEKRKELEFLINSIPMKKINI